MTTIPIQSVKTGDILAVSRHCRWWNPATWIPWRIQATTQSPWNHVALCVFIGGELKIVEAKPDGGVVVGKLDQYLDGKHSIALARPAGSTTMQGQTAAAWAMQQVGCPYDLIKIMKIRALQLIVGHNVVELIPVQDDDRMFICSELVIRAWRVAGRKLGDAYSGPGEVMSHVTIYQKA